MQDRIIRQYIVLSALYNAVGLSFISAIYVTFLMKHGLNLFEVNMVNACYFFTLFVCEIPTGAFADIFGRKRSFIVACALMSLSMFAYGGSNTLSGFILAEIIGAIGSTFRSGAFRAWLYDSLKYIDYQGDVTKIFSKENVACQIGGCGGAIIGSYISLYNPAYPWIAGGIGLAILTIFAQTVMREDYFVRVSISWKNGLQKMKDITVTSVKYGMNDKAVRFILLTTFVQIFSIQALNMYWQPYFKGHQVHEYWLGWIFAAILGSSALGALIIRYSSILGREKVLILRIQIIIGIVVIIAATVSKTPMILLFFFLHEMGRGTYPPLADGYLQKRIPSAERATISSFCAIAPHIGGAFGLLASGIIAQCFGISVAWIVSGSLLIVGAMLVMKNGEHNSS